MPRLDHDGPEIPHGEGLIIDGKQNQSGGVRVIPILCILFLFIVGIKITFVAIDSYAIKRQQQQATKELELYQKQMELELQKDIKNARNNLNKQIDEIFRK
jgi:hypothetical protein